MEVEEQNSAIPMENTRDSVKNREAFDFALGNILGDGYIHNTKGQLIMDQTVQRYSLWKYFEGVKLGIVNRKTDLELSYWLANPVMQEREDAETGKVSKTLSYRVFGRSLFKDWRSHFYTFKKPTDLGFGKGKSLYRKKVPDQIIEWFKSPYSLAIFYMDDGSHDDNSAILSMPEHPAYEIELIRQVLLQNFGLDTTIRYSNGRANKIYVVRNSWPKFKEIVYPTISQVPDYMYKLRSG